MTRWIEQRGSDAKVGGPARRGRGRLSEEASIVAWQAITKAQSFDELDCYLFI